MTQGTLATTVLRPRAAIFRAEPCVPALPALSVVDRAGDTYRTDARRRLTAALAALEND